MPVKLDCPRCKQSLAVPSKLLGTYALCPRCKGRIWIAVPEGLPPGKSGESAAKGDSAAAPAEPAGANASPAPPAGESNGPGSGWTPPLAGNSRLIAGRAAPAGDAQPQAPAQAQAGLPAVRSSAPRGLAPAAPTAPAAPAVAAPLPPIVATKKTARLISPEAAASSLQLAADGKLPELHLDDGARTVDADGKGRAVSPLILTAILCLSASFSMVAVLTDFDAPNAAAVRRKAEARQRIEANYFPLVADQGRARPAQTYQRYLAEAARAHARGDPAAERRLYNRVLDLLRAERGRFDRGLTGSPQRDKELERLITSILGDG